MEINRLIAMLEIDPDVLNLIKLFSEDASGHQAHQMLSMSMDDQTANAAGSGGIGGLQRSVTRNQDSVGNKRDSVQQ